MDLVADILVGKEISGILLEERIKDMQEFIIWLEILFLFKLLL